MRVTVNFFHPFPRLSNANRALFEAIQGIEGVEARDLYELYPEFSIDVEREHEILERTDVLVMQHPIYWYSAPSLMKEWMDSVLEHGWAYGPGGEKLRGKRWLQAVTTGSPHEAYLRSGYHVFTLREFLRPFEQSARFCGMIPLDPFISHGAAELSEDGRKERSELFRERLTAIVRGDLPPEYETRHGPEVGA